MVCCFGGGDYCVINGVLVMVLFFCVVCCVCVDVIVTERTLVNVGR